MTQNIGDVTVTNVVESEGPLLGPTELYPDLNPDQLLGDLAWLTPRFRDPASGLFIMAIQSFVVRSGGKTILVDTCVGDCRQRKRAFFTDARWNWLDKLRAAGFEPEDVDFVLSTHLHVDHVGWNTHLVDGKWVPTFPNARYLFAKPEYEYWLGEQGRAAQTRMGDYTSDAILPVIAAGLADFVEMDHRIDAALRLLPTPGHTPGHVCLDIVSGGRRAIIAGDLLHTVAQCQHPEWSTFACIDAAASRVTRTRFMAEFADTDVLLFLAHFPQPSAGYLKRADAAYRFDFLPN
jgi:glyoxylase-like metal-dependent hydrolase (beta-lactamase superfamily II)